MAEATETLEELAVRYVAVRAGQGRFAGKTPKTVRYTLAGFCRFVGPVTPAELGRNHIEDWLAFFPMSPATGRTRLSHVRAFCKWLVTQGIIVADPTLEIVGARPTRYLPRALPGDAVARLLDACPDRRARFICTAMVQLGLRCVEVAGLTVEDVDGEGIRVRGKGGHERILPMLPDVAVALDAYLAQHPATSGPIVRNDYNGAHDGMAMEPAHVSTLVSRWMRDAGIKGRPGDGVSAHALRHTAATDALRGGAHLRDVQAALGHASLATTERYLGLQVEGLSKALGGRHYGPGQVPDQGLDLPADLTRPDTLEVLPSGSLTEAARLVAAALEGLAASIDRLGVEAVDRRPPRVSQPTIAGEVKKFGAEVLDSGHTPEDRLAPERTRRVWDRTDQAWHVIPDDREVVACSVPGCGYEDTEQFVEWHARRHCPECGGLYRSLGSHRARKHGVKAGPAPASCVWGAAHDHTAGGYCICPLCQQTSAGIATSRGGGPRLYGAAAMPHHVAQPHEKCADCDRSFISLDMHRRRAHPWARA